MAGVADVVIVAAWSVVVGHNVVLALRGVHRGGDARRWVASALLVAGVLAAGVVLERRTGGPVAAPPVLVALGLLAVVAGASLHVAARRVLGAEWSSRATAPVHLVDRGPYAVVRHPLYLGLGLLAGGSMAAHASLPVLAGGVGLLVGIASKIVWEERALAAAFGAAWEAYRRRVPRLVPRRRRSD